MSRINYIPFARRQRLTVPGNTAGTPGRNFTRLADLRPGACKRAHILDAIIWQSDGGGKSGNWGDSLKMRYGINGKNYFTSEFFDYRAFQSGHMPLISCWDWSRDPKHGGRRYPYRIYPGQSVRVMVKYETAQMQGRNRVVPSATFNCVKVRGGAPEQLQTSLATPPQIPAGVVPPLAPIIQAPNLILQCPTDSPLDLYSITVGEWSAIFSRAVYVLDANERPWWQAAEWERIIDPLVAPLLLGGQEWTLDPDEVPTFEFENEDDGDAVMDVTIRGVLEVEDPNG